MTHIKVEEYSDWIKVRDGVTGKILHEGHSVAPFHWSNILSNYGVRLDIEYIEEDDEEDETTPIQIPEWWTTEVQTEILNFGNTVASQQILKAN